MGGDLHVGTDGNCNVSVGGDEGGGLAQGAVAHAGDVRHDVDVASEHEFARGVVVQDDGLCGRSRSRDV